MSRYTRLLLILIAIVAVCWLAWRFGLGGGYQSGSQ